MVSEWCQHHPRTHLTLTARIPHVRWGSAVLRGYEQDAWKEQPFLLQARDAQVWPHLEGPGDRLFTAILLTHAKVLEHPDVKGFVIAGR